MPLVNTPAVVLHSFRYGETSKIIRLGTRDYGVQSVIAKGAQRSKTRFGAKLELFAEGEAQFVLKENRDLHTLSAFDLGKLRRELAGNLLKYASAECLAEVVIRCAPPEGQPEVFDHLGRELDRLVDCSPEEVSSVALRALWGLVSLLGFTPTLDQCVRDGRPLPEGAAAFSRHDGGFLCAACAATGDYSKMPAADRDALELFLSANGELPRPPTKHAEAHRRLLADFVRRHLAEDRQMRALDFWERAAWNDT